MPTISVCVEMLLGDDSLAEKAKSTAEAGFRAIEFWFHDQGPGDRNLQSLAAVCRAEDLLVNDIVVNAPDGSIGGSLVSPDDRDKYLARLRQTISVAKQLNCRKLITCSGNRSGDQPASREREAITDTLGAAAEIAVQEGFTLLLEPLNSLVDHAGYYLDDGNEAARITQEVGSPGLKLLWDIYHMQIMHGNVLANIERHLPLIGHFHAAGVPGRHELDGGELDYPVILSRIASWGYGGCLGLEYTPAMADHVASLARMRELTAAAGWE